MDASKIIIFLSFAVLLSSLVSADVNVVTEENNYTHLSLSNSNLFFYAPFDFKSASNKVHDFSANNYDGLVMGGAVYNTSCLHKGCFYFDGLNDAKDDYLNFPVLKNSNRFGSSFTVSTWVRNKESVSPSLKSILGTQYSPNASLSGWALRLDSSGTKIQFVISNGTKAVTANALSANVGVNQWHHVVGVYDNVTKTTQVYVDGVPGSLVSGAPYNGGISNTDFRIGMTTAFGKIWHGDIDEVMIFGTALNVTQINDLYQNQTNRFYSSGEKLFSNLHVSDEGNKINITVESSFVYFGTGYKVAVGNNNGAGYSYGPEYDLVNGKIDNVPVSTISNLSIKVLFYSNVNGFYSPLMIGNVSAVLSDQPPLPPRDYTLERQKVAELINGANHTIRVLYMGNSRVARPTGFAFDGLEEIVYDSGRLAGNGFVVPADTGGTSIADDRFLVNRAYGITTESSTWTATDSISTQYDHAEFLSLALVPGRVLRMSRLMENIPMLPRTVALNMTIDYLAGPTMGTFRFTPVEVSNNVTIKYSHPSTDINASDTYYHVVHREVILPVMNNASLGRSFTLTGISGNNTVFRVGVSRDVPNGVYVSEMAIGGVGFQGQADEIPAESWADYVAAEKPDIVLWQFASNDGLDGVVDATKDLMDRVESVAPDAVNLVFLETPAPRSDIDKLINYSAIWAEGVEGYNGAIVLNTTAFLPEDFLALKGTCKTSCKYGPYFSGAIHENRFGARTVGNAVWAAMANFSNFTEPDDSLVTSCRDLNIQDKVYTLQNDISSSGTCITVSADNVTLNGQGHSITYSVGGGSGSGIVVNASDYFTILDSNIIEGSSTGVGNYGIYLLNSNNATVLRNSVTSLGQSGSGIVSESSFSNNFSGNNISTSAVNGDAISLLISNYSSVEGNTIITLGNSANGLVLTGSSANNFLSNYISTSGLGSKGLDLLNSADNIFIGTQFSISNSGIVAIDDSASIGNSFVDTVINGRNEAYNDISLNTEGIDDTSFINTYFKGYSFAGVGSLVLFRSSNLGEISFLSPINGSGTNLADDVIIGNNLVSVRSDVNVGLNGSAQITLYGLPTNFVNPEIKRDDLSCPIEICTNLTGLNDGTVVFTVTSWSNYSIGEIV